jgi:hypothetical protein
MALLRATPILADAGWTIQGMMDKLRLPLGGAPMADNQTDRSDPIIDKLDRILQKLESMDETIQAIHRELVETAPGKISPEPDAELPNHE